MSVVYVGAYAWSFSDQTNSHSTSADTSVTDVIVNIRNAGCSNCISATSVQGTSSGANSYGGSMSVVYVGAYLWSFSDLNDSHSTSADTSVSDVSVNISNAGCSNCIASTSSKDGLMGANSYGGSMSVVYVGAYAWSRSSNTSSSSTSAETSASGVSVSISSADCSNCSSVAFSDFVSAGANSYGGSMSVVYIGAYAWSRSDLANSVIASGATSARVVSVSISSADCSSCSAVSFGRSEVFGALSFGGAICLYVGAYGYSYSNGAIGQLSRLYSNVTRVFGLSISVQKSGIRLSQALNREFCCGIFYFISLI
jgi:hypothetical protein